MSEWSLNIAGIDDNNLSWITERQNRSNSWRDFYSPQIEEIDGAVLIRKYCGLCGNQFVYTAIEIYGEEDRKKVEKALFEIDYKEFCANCKEWVKKQRGKL